MCRKKQLWNGPEINCSCLVLVVGNKFREEKNNFQIWHAHHKATGMTIFCWAKTISNNSLILTNYFEKHLKLTHWYDGPIWIKPLKEVFLGPRGPHGIPSHIITGIYASWIIWRLIKPTPPQPSTAQCSLIPVQPSTAKYSQYPNPTRNPNFLVKPDPNPTRSQKALLVRAWTSVTASTSFESASSSTTFSQISATWVTDEVTMEDNMGLIKQNTISLPSFYSSYQENWGLNYLHNNKFIPPKELFFQSFRSRSDLKL